MQHVNSLLIGLLSDREHVAAVGAEYFISAFGHEQIFFAVQALDKYFL